MLYATVTVIIHTASEQCNSLTTTAQDTPYNPLAKIPVIYDALCNRVDIINAEVATE